MALCSYPAFQSKLGFRGGSIFRGSKEVFVGGEANFYVYIVNLERASQRKRETDRQTDRQRQRQTDRQTDRQRQRDRDRQTGRQADRQKSMG